LKSRRNILASLTLLVVMGCQQRGTVVRTEGAARGTTPTVVPFTTPDATDDFEPPIVAVTPVPNPGELASMTRVATAWTSQSLSLQVLPGSPVPPRPVVETAPENVAVAAPEVKATPIRVAPASATAPATTSAPTTTAAPVATAAPAPAIAVAPSAASDIAARTNGVRTSRGLAPLARDAALDSAASGWAHELATSGVLRHSTLPEQLVGKPWSTVGENIGVGPSSGVVHDALVNSASHLANIVGPNFSRIGVGAYTDATGRLWIVEVFAG